MWKSKVTVTGVKEGTTKITFKETLDDGEGNKTESYRTCAVENTYLKPKITTGPKTIYVGKTASIATVKLATSVTYSSSKTSVATVSNKGVVKGVAAGTATITITAKAGSVINKTTAKVTVKKMANPITVKAKTAKVSSKKKSTLAPAKYVAVTKAQGTLTYKKLKGDGKITIAKNGKMTVKKGLKKGKTYSVYVQVTAKGNAKYLAGTKKFTAKIKVS
ncbi:MAG: Ig-like domain-containing protein [Ruminococcus sp.]|nr:Ig-like domain-containing protein [Ruminococcus sp.]